ncbi:MAG: calcium/sodium antiporter [Desulfovibrio sp.]|nr:calcium/sodium antiporter [Desulfovibrio sp.]
MLLVCSAIIAGIALLVWSADRFVDGAANVARRCGMPPLLVGIAIVGFGTSAPEMLVSGVSAWQGNAGIALGNAFGSNIANIALILGVTALVSPVPVKREILFRELPALILATALTVWLLWDGRISRLDAAVLIGVFFASLGFSIVRALRQGPAEEPESGDADMSLARALFWLVTGLIVLVASSRVLVWGAVEAARWCGVSDLVIGLTVIAIGTSLPELASSIAAARKGEHDIALGNVIGSNLFNTLLVVGIAGAVAPFAADPEVLRRDVPVMIVLTLALFFLGIGIRKAGRIGRFKGLLLTIAYAAYTCWVAWPLLRPQIWPVAGPFVEEVLVPFLAPLRDAAGQIFGGLF